VGVTVVLVDDIAELRAIVRRALRLRGGFDVVAEVGDGASAIAAARDHRPDIVVLDLGLPDLAGHEVLTGVRAASPGTQVVVYTGSVTHDRFDMLRQVAGFVRKDEDIRYLVDLLEDLGRRYHRQAAIRVRRDLGDVAVARRFVADHCRVWGCEDIVHDAELVVTELVTNALVHAQTRCEVRVRRRDRFLRIEVMDEGDGTPDLLAAGEHAEHGRGLVLVSAVGSAWGVEARPPAGKMVWVELFTASDPPGAEEEGGTSASTGERRIRPAGGDAPGGGPVGGTPPGGRGGVARRLPRRVDGARTVVARRA
jgi:DNA-binding response OmpR family regulator